jgi:hypothetical protein
LVLFGWREVRAHAGSLSTEKSIKEGLEASTVNERLRMTLLSPTIIESILNGTQSEELTMKWLTRNSFSNNWSQQVFN